MIVSVHNITFRYLTPLSKSLQRSQGNLSRLFEVSSLLNAPVMATEIILKDLLEITHDDENGLIFEKNVSIPRKGTYPIRCNVYRPIAEKEKYPVLVTYGPYGKDIPYEKYAS
jgi:hypothetical protein